MRYPVDKVRCSHCPVCSLVTKSISAKPLEEKDMYYQCLAMAEDLCGEESKRQPQKQREECV